LTIADGKLTVTAIKLFDFVACLTWALGQQEATQQQTTV